MINDNVKLGELFDILSEDIDVKCPLDEWYKALINKRIKDLNINDICKMLRQGIFVEIAIKKAIEILKQNPKTGDFYDGQLIKSICAIDFSEYKQYLAKMKEVLMHIENTMNGDSWLIEQDFEEYINNIHKLLNTINNSSNI